jgi:hypothetical protein
VPGSGERVIAAPGEGAEHSVSLGALPQGAVVRVTPGHGAARGAALSFTVGSGPVVDVKAVKRAHGVALTVMLAVSCRARLKIDVSGNVETIEPASARAGSVQRFSVPDGVTRGTLELALGEEKRDVEVAWDVR